MMQSVLDSQQSVLRNFLMTMYVTFAISYNYFGVNFNCAIYDYCLLLIGASLSEPHTSVTAMSMCVCICACLERPLTINFK